MVAADASDPQAQQSSIHFPGMEPSETFHFYFRRHWTRVARYVIFLAAWMLLFAFFVVVSGVTDMEDDSTRRTLVVVLSLFFLIPHIIFIIKLYKHFLCVVIVTDKKIHHFKRTILAMDTHQAVDLWMLQDVDKLQRSIIQNLFGFGSLQLEAQNTRIRLHFVPHINDIYNIIVGLREGALQKATPRKALQAIQMAQEGSMEGLNVRPV